MSSELSVGHHRGGGGDRLETPRTVPGGLLGADYSVENGRYRFKKVYGGLNWNPQLRAPLTEPGVNVRAGEYLLAVRGQRRAAAGQHLQLLREHRRQDRRDHRRPESGRHRLAHRAGRAGRERRRAAESRLGRGQPAESGCRPPAGAWPTSTCRTPREPGYTYFKRYFYPQAHKDAVIVDERFNGGGQIADYYIDILRRPLISYWAMRYGDDLRTPAASIQGPKVMIIDETAGSGGDLAAVDVPQVRASARSSVSARGAASSACSASRR